MVAPRYGENITVMGCMNALGLVILITVLFKGKMLQPSLVNDIALGTSIEMTDKGPLTHPTFVK
jgi:hypothetical protein